jgi:MarR family transcriptional regulator for hemolysin
MRDGSSLAHTQWRIGITISQIARRWRGRLDARIAEFGLTEARWLALLALARGSAERNGQDLTQKELANRLRIEGPTLVRTLDWLEGEGLVERRESAIDRRAKTLHLTAKAMPLIHRIEAAATLVRAEILGGIPEADLAACLAVLDRVATGLAAAPAAAPTEEAHDGRRPG